jgi:hypothetical protein
MMDMIGNSIGFTEPFGKDVYLDNKYLGKLDSNQIVELYNTIVHEAIHRDQSAWYLLTHPFEHPEVYKEANLRTKEAEEYIRAWYPKCP